MDGEQQIRDACQAWQALTQVEAQAIESISWERLLEAQEQKRRLQCEIDRHLLGLSEPERRLLLARLAPMVRELKEAERANSQSLDRQHEVAEEEKRNVEESERNLRQLRQAYAPTAAPVWDHYS